MTSQRLLAALRDRLRRARRRIDAALARLGPRVFIVAHWPLRRPYMRERLTLEAYGGGLGDELMALPVIEEIKRRNPRCRVTFVTRRPDFFRRQPNIDEVLKSAKGIASLKLVYNNAVPPPRPLMSLMAECAGIVATFPRIPALHVTASESIKNLMAGLPKPLVVVQPLASGWTTNKAWPLPYWNECVRALGEAGCQVVEIGTEPALDAGGLGPRFTPLAGRTNLDDLVYIVSRADLFIGPSSSGMHLANAYDVPALIIFGGYESPAGYEYANVHPLYSPVECAPCWRQDCPYQLKCLHAIAPATVVAQALRMLEKSPAPAKG